MENEARKVVEEFENANAFTNSINLEKDITRSVLFENGKQWNMDEDLKDFPKITLNIIKQIGKTRRSNIMQNEYGYLVNSTNFKSVRKIQDFLKHLAATTNMRNKDLKALNDDYTKGTAIGYFYWDAEKRGFMRKSGGEMRYEVVDIRNFRVANPYIQSIQEQEWVIFVTREKVASLRYKYGKDIDVVPDGNLYTKGTEKEPVAGDFENELVNVYTKFYRNEEGEVYSIIVTATTVLRGAEPLNYLYKKKKAKETPNTTSLHDKPTKTDDDYLPAWNLYPFARLSLNERDNCFYGLPITLEYLETQKSINNHFSVYDKALQDNVLGGYVYKRGILGENEITTDNGQMIELDLLPNENINAVFGRMPVANVPSDSHNYSNNLIGVARQVAGASNVQLGMSDFAGQSGKQTEMLLQRAAENASDTAMMFNEFKREQAHIMFLFAKFYYDNEDFVIINHGVNEDNVRPYTGEDAFNGNEYIADDVYIDIKVGTAPSFSEYSNIELLGMMVQSGQAPFEAYVSMLPDGYISNRQEILKIAQNNSLKQLQQMQEVVKQQQQAMEQMAKAYQDMMKDKENIDVIIRENDSLRTMLAEVTAKAIERVGASGKEKQEMAAEIQKLLKIAAKK